MSLYIGKDNNGNSLFHLTGGVTSSNSMKSPIPISNSVFHSSLQYVLFTPYHCTVNQHSYTVQTFNGGLVVTKTVHGIVLNIDNLSAALVDIRDNHRVFMVMAKFSDNTYKSSFGYTFDPSYDVGIEFFSQDLSAHNSTFSTSYPRPFIGDTSITDAWVYTLNATVQNGFIYPPKTGGITIGNGGINLNNNDLLNIRYLSSTSVNTIDHVGAVGNGGSMQFINSVAPSGTSISISYNSGTDMKILQGSKTIFSSSQKLGKLHFTSWAYRALPSRTINFGTVVDIPLGVTGLSNGDYVIFTSALSAHADRISSLFRVGTSAYYEPTFGEDVSFNSITDGIISTSGVLNYRYDASKLSGTGTITASARYVSILIIKN